ncbi:MAG TPA: LysR family transcriptional regulator [Solirubrobacteraceae bacterium]|nr:LysR family transcriptional regulator [Solirubrobacteraceae bacterium]
MDFRHLRYFVAVVDEGQFVRAAGALHIAQSALSQQIRDLERELGAELLHRDRRGVTPTTAGEVLLGHARALLERAELARAEVAQLTGVITGTLRIASGSPSGPVPLPATLAEFQHRHPAVEIVIRDAPSEELIRWLEDGTVDVAVITFAPDRLPTRLQGTLITRERLLALVPYGHALAGRDRVSLAELASESLVTFPDGSGVRQTIDEGFRAAGAPRPAVTAETIDPLAMIELVGVGLGVAIVPPSFADLATPAVRAIELAPPGLLENVTLAWPRERRALPALDAFLELAADWLPHEP